MNAKIKLDNPDYIPIALYELGGVGKFVDIENLFMRCYELAPERFKWRNYEFPNYKILSKALRDFEERHSGLLIKTPDGLQRQLSAEGIKWVRRKLPVYEKLMSAEVREPPTRRPSQRILNDLSNNELFLKYKAGSRLAATKYEIADMLLCSPDSPNLIWKERLETFRSAAEISHRSDLVEFLYLIQEEYPEFFGDENG